MRTLKQEWPHIRRLKLRKKLGERNNARQKETWFIRQYTC